MGSIGDFFRGLARSLELDRLFDGETRFFVGAGTPREAAAVGSDPAGRAEAPPALQIRVGSPFIAPAVAAAPDAAPPGSQFATSFVASWRPAPSPPDRWIQFLLAAPFGTRTTSARELRWNGREISVERVTEGEIEAFVSMMREWVEYANREFAAWQATPEVRANYEAQSRARQLQEKLRR